MCVVCCHPSGLLCPTPSVRLSLCVSLGIVVARARAIRSLWSETAQSAKHDSSRRTMGRRRCATRWSVAVGVVPPVGAKAGLLVLVILLGAVTRSAGNFSFPTDPDILYGVCACVCVCVCVCGREIGRGFGCVWYCALQ